MKYDVFISYSRKDMAAADALCQVLDGAGVSYWIDRNIHGSANFLSEITHNIRHCKVVVFIASPNSAVSPWTQKEILFALKHKKEIVPYRIGNFRFEDNDELDFIFTNIQWIESPSAVVTALEALDCCKTIVLKTYKVGDYYNDGVREGVVFEVTLDGQHGKIVSMKQSMSPLEWSSDYDEQRRLIGADSKTDGATNMAKIKTVSDWQNKYPAFAWCADLGDGWYLPANDELLIIFINKDKIQPRLVGKMRDFYWSSTEENYQDSNGEFCAWWVNMFLGYLDLYHKSNYIFVRAVATF